MSSSVGSKSTSEEIEEEDELLLPPNLIWKLALLLHHSEVHISTSRDAQRFRISIKSGVQQSTYHVNFKDFQTKFYDELSKLPNPYEYLDHLGSYFVQEKCLFLEVHFTSVDQMKRCIDGIEGAGLVEKVNDTFKCFITSKNVGLFKLNLVVCSSIDQKFRFVSHENASYAYELVYTPNPAFATVHIRCKSKYMEIKSAYSELLKLFPNFFGCLMDEDLPGSETKGSSSPQPKTTELDPDISDIELYDIAEKIIPNKWKKVGVHMNFDANSLQRIEVNNKGDVLHAIFTMLSEAKSRSASPNFRHTLSAAIYQAGYSKLAREINPQLKYDKIVKQNTISESEEDGSSESEDDESKLVLVDGSLKFYDKVIAEKHLQNQYWIKNREKLLSVVREVVVPYTMQTVVATPGSLIVNVSIMSFNGCYRLAVDIFTGVFLANVETKFKALGYTNTLQVDFNIGRVRVTPENCYNLYIDALHASFGTSGPAKETTKRGAIKFSRGAVKTDASVPSPSLAQAIRNGAIDVVKSLLSEGRDPNEYFDGYTPLHIAASIGKDEIVEILVRSGATLDVTTTSDEQYTPMHLAAHTGHLTTIKLLLDLGASIDLRSGRGKTPLWLAAAEGYGHIVDYLISQGADPNAQDSIGGTPLHTAAGQKRKSAVQALINGGADITIPDDAMSTPVHEALKTGDVDLLRLIISKNPTVVNDIPIEPPLTAACKMQNLEMIKFLLVEASANPNVENKDHLTPLLLACLHENTELMELLVKHGASTEVISKHFSSVLHLSAKEGKVNATRKLLELGVPCDLMDDDGYTPLRDAVVDKRHATVEILLDAGASIEAGTPPGMLPLFHVPAKNNDVQMLEILLAHNCDSLVTFRDGSTALHRAASLGNSEAIHFLCCQIPVLLNFKSLTGITPLYTAIRSKNFTSAMEILIYDPDVNICNHDGVSPLLICIDFNGPIELVEQLIFHKAKIHYPVEITEWGKAVNPVKSPILVACKNGQAENVRILLEANRGFLQEVEPSVQHIILFCAIDSGNLETLRVILEHGADPNVLPHNEAFSPLIKACFCGGVEMVKLLIQYGGKPGMACSDKQITPLITACEHNNVEIVKLLAPRVDVNEKKDNGYTALHTIAIDGSSEIAQLLIDNGAIVDKKSYLEWTPLHVAASTGNIPVIDVLLHFGANIEARDRTKTTPLLRAVQYHEMDTVRHLLDRRASVEVRAIYGLHVLHFAAFYGEAQILEFLIEKCENLNVQDESGMTPLHLATLEGHMATIKSLLSHEASPNITNESGFTPLHIAVAYDYVEIAQLLISKGANPEVEVDGSIPADFSKSEVMTAFLWKTTGEKQPTEEEPQEKKPPTKEKPKENKKQEAQVKDPAVKEEKRSESREERRATKVQELKDVRDLYQQLLAIKQGVEEYT